jgi:hypothetical protein
MVAYMLMLAKVQNFRKDDRTSEAAPQTDEAWGRFAVWGGPG